jgi:hypothetical protein
MSIGRSHIDSAWLDRLAVDGMCHRQWPGAVQDLRKQARMIGRRCSTMKIAAGRFAGRPETRRLSASTPPLDVPTTIMSCPGMCIASLLSYVKACPLQRLFEKLLAGAFR